MLSNLFAAWFLLWCLSAISSWRQAHPHFIPKSPRHNSHMVLGGVLGSFVAQRPGRNPFTAEENLTWDWGVGLTLRAAQSRLVHGLHVVESRAQEAPHGRDPARPFVSFVFSLADKCSAPVQSRFCALRTDVLEVHVMSGWHCHTVPPWEGSLTLVSVLKTKGIVNTQAHWALPPRDRWANGRGQWVSSRQNRAVM